MVIDQLESLDEYASLHPRFPAAFAYLRRLLSQNAPDGKHILTGTEIPEEIFVSIATNELAPQAAARAESHRKYIDVQVILSGSEVIYAPACLPAVTEDNAEKDYLLYQEVPLSDCHRLLVRSGGFAIFFPGELHAPCHSASTAPSTARKAILKVLR